MEIPTHSNPPHSVPPQGAHLMGHLFQRIPAHLVQYGLALSLTSLAILLKFWLASFIGLETLLLLLTVGVTVSAWAGGLVPGMLATVSGTVGVVYFVIPPTPALAISDTRMLITVLVFVLSGSMISLLSEARKRAERARNAYISSLVSEMNERRQMETALQRANERLNLAIDALDGFIYEYSYTTGAVERSSGFVKVTGYTPEEVPPAADWWYEQTHPDDRAVVAQAASDALAADTQRALEYRIQHRDGSYVDVWDTARILRDAAGQVVRLVGITINMTERKRLERVLRERERFIESIMAVVPSVIYLFDLTEQRNIYISTHASDFLGYTPDEVIAQGSAFLSTRLHPDDGPRMADHMARVNDLIGDETLEIEYRLRHKNGDWRWFWSRDRVFARTAESHPQQALGVAQDITERKRAEEGLRTSEVRFRRLVENNIVGIVLANMEAITYANNAFLQVVGYTSDDLARGNIRWRDMTPPEYHHLDEQALQEMLATGICTPFEKEYVRKDGSRVAILIGASLLERAPLTWVCFVLDITERRRAELARTMLAETGKLLASALDHATMLDALLPIVLPAFADSCTIDLWQADGSLQRRVVVAEPAGVEVGPRLNEYPPAPHPSQPIWGVLRSGKPTLIAEVSAPMPEPDALHGEQQTTAEPVLVQESVQTVEPHSAIIVPLTARGRTLGTLAFALHTTGRSYDTTDLALAEELGHRAALALDNARLYREAQEAVRMRDQFFVVAAHELKTPLTAMLGHASLLERRLKPEAVIMERDLRALRTIGAQTRRLDKMINALLDVSRLARGQLTVENQPLDLCALVERVVEEVQPVAERHTVLCSLPEQHLIVQGDELRLEQVLQNLLGNAVKYSPQGGTVHVWVAQHNTDVHVSISDQGIGVPPEAIPHLFTRFYRVDSTETQHINGLGLGLYVVKEILTLHGGSIEVTSTVGAGSTFTVCLPLVQVEERA